MSIGCFWSYESEAEGPASNKGKTVIHVKTIPVGTQGMVFTYDTRELSLFKYAQYVT